MGEKRHTHTHTTDYYSFFSPSLYRTISSPIPSFSPLPPFSILPRQAQDRRDALARCWQQSRKQPRSNKSSASWCVCVSALPLGDKGKRPKRANACWSRSHAPTKPASQPVPASPPAPACLLLLLLPPSACLPCLLARLLARSLSQPELQCVKVSTSPHRHPLPLHCRPQWTKVVVDTSNRHHSPACAVQEDEGEVLHCPSASLLCLPGFVGRRCPRQKTQHLFAAASRAFDLTRPDCCVA